MNPKALIKAAEQVVRSNSPAILAGLGISGVIGTAYLSRQAGINHAWDRASGPPTDSKEDWKRCWKLYIPAAIAGGATIGCIIGAVKIGNRRTAAITAAYSLSEKAFVEYKEKVAEKIGERKAQTVRDEIAQDRVSATAPGREIVLVGAGPVPCCELHTGRYFHSDMETLKRAQNEINDRILKHDYATLAEFHHLIKISPTDSAGDFGWDQSRGFLDLEITTTLMEETRPCLAFSYNYLKAL